MTVELVKRLPRNDSYSGTNRYRALVRCSCGNEYETGYFSYKRTKSCRDCIYSGRTVDSGSVCESFVSRARKNAKRRGIQFDITHEYLNEVYISQTLPGEECARCVYSGRPLMNESSSRTTMSLDRIDSSLPYQVGNVQLLDKQVNIGKHTLTEDRFLFLVHQATVPVLAPQIDLEFEERAKSFRGKGAFSGERITSIRRNAERRNIEFDLDADILHEQFLRQRGTCAFSGLGLFAETVSIDRIDNSFGYTKDNIHLVLKEMNFMRGAQTIDEFRVMLDDIFEWTFIVLPNLIERNDVLV